MPEVKFLLREPIHWQDAMVIVAFPTAGSAASIAARYLRNRLTLPLLGSVHMDDQGPVVAVQDGIATSPLRIHGGQVECKLGDERCPSVYVISSDLAMDPRSLSLIADSILQETRGARLVLSLDAIVRDEGDDKPDVFCVASNETVLALLQTDDVEPMVEAHLVGVSGQVLLSAEMGGLPGGALLVQALEKVPDGRAAAALIAAVDRLLPTVDIDAKPLLEEAMELEKVVAQAQRNAARQSSAPPGSHTFI